MQGADTAVEGAYPESQRLNAHENDVQGLLCPYTLAGFRRQLGVAFQIEGPGGNASGNNTTLNMARAAES